MIRRCAIALAVVMRLLRRVLREETLDARWRDGGMRDDEGSM